MTLNFFLFRTLDDKIPEANLVSNIETAYARAKEHGAITVSEGVIKYDNGRAALIRDPDVGGYVLLWEPGR